MKILHTYLPINLIAKKMKKFNFKSKKLLTTAFFITSGLTIISSSNPVRAEGVCPPASAVSSPNGFGDSTSFVSNATVDGITYPNGNCYGTPETYGVTVYRMGLCTSNPAPTSSGTSPDVSSCSFTFSKVDGEEKSFAAGGTESLSEEYSLVPDVGDYRYAVIEIANSFDIQASYGPLSDGTTYYTNGTFGSFGKTTGSSGTGSDYAVTEAPLNTFYGDEGDNVCTGTASEVVSGGTISAYLLTAPSDSSDTSSYGTLIADDPTIFPCSGVDRLFGVMDLGDDNKVSITSSTTSLTATFTVTNNGVTIIYDDDGNGLPTSDPDYEAEGIGFDSGPFSVSFTTSE